MVSIASRIALPGIAGLLAACSVSPPQPSPKDARLPEPDSLRKFVASVATDSGRKVSPDGRKMLWHTVAGQEVLTYVRNIEGGETSVFRVGRKLPYWACDSRHLIAEVPPAGGQDTQVLLLDAVNPGAAPVNLTPWAGSRSYVIHAGESKTGKLILVSNRRDAAAYDVYAADPATGKVEMLWKNSGDVVRWIMDVDGTVGARVRHQDEHYIIQVLDKASTTWKSVGKWTEQDLIQPIRIDRAAGNVFVMSRLLRDRKAEPPESAERGLPCAA